MPPREHDIRVKILETLLTTPHRDLDALWPIHTDMQQPSRIDLVLEILEHPLPERPSS